MIPDFKTYLRESIWSDMQDRGTRDVIKKEDDIDLMDIEDFKEYLKKRYICTKSRRRWKVDSWFLGGENTLMQVDMPIEDISEPGIKITYCLRLTYDYGKMECIDISSSYQTFFEEYPEFKKYVSDNYRLIKKSKDDFRLFVSDNLIVSKPGKELKFHDYVELVDKALSCVKKPYLKRVMNESIWSDMQERGTGDIIKTEDISSINNMKKDQFFDFLCNRYKQVSGEKWFNRDYYQSTISFPVFSTKDDNEEFSVFITGFRDITKSVYVRDNFILNASDMLKKLQDNFTVDIVYKDDTEPDWAEIYPKDQSEITNYFFVTVVDFLIDNVDTNKYKRMQERSGSLKESIWSDMQERGTGNMTKREDDIDLLDRYGFFAYLNKIYRTTPPAKIRNYDELNSILVPLFGVNKALLPSRHLSIEMEYNDGQDITVGKMLMSNFPQIEADLRDSFNVEDMPAGEMRGEYLKINPKDGSPVTNSFFITVIDFLLEKARDKYTIILFKK